MAAEVVAGVAEGNRADVAGATGRGETTTTPTDPRARGRT